MDSLLVVMTSILLLSAMDSDSEDTVSSCPTYHSEQDALSATEYYLASRNEANLTVTQLLQSDLCFMQTLNGMPNAFKSRLEVVGQCVACILKNDWLQKMFENETNTQLFKDIVICWNNLL